MPSNPDENHVCRCTAMDIAKAIGVVIGALTTAAASLMGAYYGMLNHDRIGDVHAVQDQQVERSKAHDVTLGQIEKTTNKTAENVSDTLGPQLAAAAKYLAEIAADDPTPENKLRASEAEKIYKEYLAKRKKP